MGAEEGKMQCCGEVGVALWVRGGVHVCLLRRRCPKFGIPLLSLLQLITFDKNRFLIDDCIMLSELEKVLMKDVSKSGLGHDSTVVCLSLKGKADVLTCISSFKSRFRV